jgi:hypothetical protein
MCPWGAASSLICRGGPERDMKEVDWNECTA